MAVSLANVTPAEYLTTLREAIARTFDLEEVRQLMFDVGVDYDELRGEGKSAKIQALLEHLEKRRQLPDLLACLKKERSAEDWDRHHPAELEASSP